MEPPLLSAEPGSSGAGMAINSQPLNRPGHRRWRCRASLVGNSRCHGRSLASTSNTRTNALPRRKSGRPYRLLLKLADDRTVPTAIDGLGVPIVCPSFPPPLPDQRRYPLCPAAEYQASALCQCARFGLI
jgi:hypothetical protein